MSSDITRAADLLKFAAMRMLVCQLQFQDGSGSPAAGAALGGLRHLHTELADAVQRLCPDGQNTEAWSARYADGRPVISAMPLDGGPGLFVHVWHPDPTHPMNNPGALDVVTTRDGSRKQVIVTAPGYIDAVSLPETATASATLGHQ